MNFLATNAPALPVHWLMHLGLHLAWSVVLAYGGIWVVGWFFGRYGNRLGSQKPQRHAWQTRAAIVLGVCAWLPGPWSPAYWLGLAFQMPSMVTVLLCGVLLYRTFTRQVLTEAVVRSSRNSLRALTLMGVVLGWALLLDTFALLPMQLYAWGFSPAAVAVVLLVSLLPWALSVRGPLDALAWIAPVAVLLFVVLRLPTGNVWDAVLDPWLWLVLQVGVVRRLRGGP